MIFLLKNFYIFALMLSLNSVVFANNLCMSSFNVSSNEDSDSTSSLLAYLATLFEEGILNLEDLITVKRDLAQGIWRNPIDDSISKSDSVLQVHFLALEDYIRSHSIHLETVLQWLEKTIDQETHLQKSKNILLSNTTKLPQEITLHPIVKSATYNVTLMTTLVTQFQWAEIMGESPSVSNHGSQKLLMDVDGKKIHLQPNHPVENITWWSALVFANELSKLHGYEPYYNFDGISFRPNTYAADGSLHPGNIEKSKYKIRRNLSGNRIPDGYRLATVDAYRTLYNQFNLFDQINSDYAWHLENSGNTTHEVARKKPHLIYGEKFYDLFGNVLEWNDIIANALHYTPLQKGCFSTSVEDIMIGDGIETFSPYSEGYIRRGNIGFRLIRYVRK